MTKLCRLIYRSKTSWDSLTFLTNSLLRKLAVDSTSRNKEKDITGILLLSDESFLQVLEGPEDAVNALYCKIIQDKLHSDVTLISYEQIANKSFDEWSMRVLDLNDLPKPAR
ncbi:BLUF domain-containing protein [Verrucomicrobiales bacterium]|nr:BLUF domain-containing protein [Verrucomicrobiales bacterium]MDB4662950.1 BLUF domain-containing protein [Verrucomicrobiales bacterium]